MPRRAARSGGGATRTGQEGNSTYRCGGAFRILNYFSGVNAFGVAVILFLGDSSLDAACPWGGRLVMVNWWYIFDWRELGNIVVGRGRELAPWNSIDWTEVPG